MQTIEQLRQVYNEYAKVNGFQSYEPQNLYKPLDYILSLGGKQMRPVLLLLATELFEGKVEKALPAAYAVELFHNFSLIHDDIMDEAAIRRGKATVHSHFGNNTAILSGDVMLVYAYQYITQVEAAILPKVMEVFNKTAIGVCEGQQMDMNFETTATVTLPEYLRMIELKTSILLHGAMKIGALVAGATDADADAIADFGLNMGIAFQLMDDYLDSFGDEASFGKRIGGDIVQNKKTYLYLEAVKLGTDTDRKELSRWYEQVVPMNQEAEKIEAVKAIFVHSGATKAIQGEMDNYRDQAISALSKLSVSEERKQMLTAFLNYITQRNH
jgi:geranylgeranyl diphosphate synthase type II